MEPFAFSPENTPLVILAEGAFGAHESKTALGVIRYGHWPISAVIDSTYAGQTVGQLTNLTCDAPIVSSVQDALTGSPQPKALLIGIAPMGGDLPASYRQIIIQAIQAGLHIISGLHVFLKDDVELAALANEYHISLWDVRQPSGPPKVARQLPRPLNTKVITMVGTDCSVGKMSAGLELHRAMQFKGFNSQFVATGQTGMMITGHGVPLDRVIGDFMAGMLEEAINQTILTHQPDWVWVEGQGSLLHPAYSGVTMALLHGSAPDGLILCHNPRLTTINQYPGVTLPPLDRFIELYETAAGWIKPAKVLGIALNTSTYPEAQAIQMIEATAQQTGLPVTDPVRFGVDVVLDIVTQTLGQSR